MTDIYYVEDDWDIARAVQEYLEKRGCRVFVFDAVGEARKALGEYVPELVLVDWNMPDGQGDGLCRWIRERWKELPVIFLTVRGEAKDIVAGLGDGADDYVVKPFELEVLYSRIQALLRRAGQKTESRMRCGGIVVDVEKMAVYCGRWEVALSQPEYQLLLVLIQNKGKIVTRKQLLSLVNSRWHFRIYSFPQKTILVYN